MGLVLQGTLREGPSFVLGTNGLLQVTVLVGILAGAFVGGLGQVHTAV